MSILDSNASQEPGYSIFHFVKASISSCGLWCSSCRSVKIQDKIINLTFTDSSLHHVEVRLLPELVALTEVGAEVVLVLHHVPGDGQADGRSCGGSEDGRHPVLTA